VKILFLTQWYPPEPGLLQQELAQTLMQRGHSVTVLTGFPNFPTGKVYPGYRVRPLHRETIAGVPVVRVPLYPDHSRSAIKRVVNYASFALAAALLGRGVVDRPDVIFVYHPPLTIGFPAYVLSRLWGIPFVYQIQDMWPETLSATGMLTNESMLQMVGKFATWVYDKADALCVISPGFRDNLVQKAVPPGKIHVIPNWVDLDSYHVAEPDPDLAVSTGLDGRFNVMFAGIIGRAQELEVVLRAAEALVDLESVQFVLVGDGVALPELEAEARNRGIANVVFLGRYPQESMPALFALADVLLVHLRDDPLFRITIPHKILTYLASAKPILAAVAGDASDVVLQAGAGVACAPGDPDALAQAVRRLYHSDPAELQVMGENGREAAKMCYSRERVVARVEEVITGVVDPSSIEPRSI
jgi:colanic acid biosynthesis glycosyl transferase WcaI